MMKTEKEKSIFAQIVAGKVMKKYKAVKPYHSLVSPYYHKKFSDSTTLIMKRKNKVKNALTLKYQKIIQEFLERDENSVMAPGIKDCITRKGVCYRKRYLIDSMGNLYKKFSAEEPVKISRSLFYKLKPFWITEKKESERDTCLCKVHSNFFIMLEKLFSLKIIGISNKNDFIASLVCDLKNRKCMYRLCEKCKNKKVDVEKNSTVVYYHQWVTENASSKGKKGLIYKFKHTIKKFISSTVDEFIKALNLQIPKYLKHTYDTHYQQENLRNLQENLKMNEVMIVMDFSENYQCKYASEVQSVHFGASKKQLSLHCGVFFWRNDENEINCMSFSTISECLRHDASAVWAHMKPIFNLISEKVPFCNIIHFQSDGPTTQYRNKSNFFFFQHYCKKLKLVNATYNFTTPGHGKSCADGAGGTVKSLCNRAVLQGKDVTSVDDVLSVMAKSDCMIKMFEVTLNDIEEMDAILPKNLVAINKTMNILQINWTNKENHLLYPSNLFCKDCLYSPPCLHFSLNSKGVSVIPVNNNSLTENKKTYKTIKKNSNKGTSPNLKNSTSSLKNNKNIKTQVSVTVKNTTDKKKKNICTRQTVNAKSKNKKNTSIRHDSKN